MRVVFPQRKTRKSIKDSPNNDVIFYSRGDRNGQLILKISKDLLINNSIKNNERHGFFDRFLHRLFKDFGAQLGAMLAF